MNKKQFKDAKREIIKAMYNETFVDYAAILNKATILNEVFKEYYYNHFMTASEKKKNNLSSFHKMHKIFKKNGIKNIHEME
jgi:hypothetical protein